MIIELPDGTEIEAPDGLPPEKVKAIVQKHSTTPATLVDDSLSTKVRKFFDPTYPSPSADLLDVGKQAATGLSLATGGPSVLRMALSGGLAGAGMSDKRDAAGIASDAAVGTVLGPVVGKTVGAIGSGLSKAAKYAQRKVGEAIGNAALTAQKEATGELASEVGRLGGFSQDLNRKVEWVIRLLDEEKSGALSESSKKALEEFRASPDYKTVLEKAAERVVATAPSAVARTAAQEAKVAAMQTDLPQTVAERTAAATSADEAKNQVKARVLRYGMPALGSALGATIGGAPGAAVGALAGAGTRPMMHALRRMYQNPAVQTQLWTGVENAATRGANLMSSAAPVAPITGPGVAPESFAQYLAKLLRERVRFQASPASEEDR